MSRFTKWYADPGEGDGEPTQSGSPPSSQTHAFIRHPDETGTDDKHSMAVIVSAEESIVGITQAGWGWLMSAAGTDEQGLTNMLYEHNRQAPSERISCIEPDSGAADLLAWMLASLERSKGATPRVALVPSALAQALNERDSARLGTPPPRKHRSS